MIPGVGLEMTFHLESVMVRKVFTELTHIRMSSIPNAHELDFYGDVMTGTSQLFGQGFFDNRSVTFKLSRFNKNDIFQQVDDMTTAGFYCITGGGGGGGGGT